MNQKSGEALAGLGPQERRELLRRLLEKKSQQARYLSLSRHQLGMWFLNRLSPGIHSYNTALAVQASPRLDVAILSKALEKLALRHGALRTVFQDRGGEPIQRIREDFSVPIRVVDVGGASEESLRCAVLEDYRLPFNLETSTLRITLFRGADFDILLVTAHHIVFDAWSANIFYRELREIYDAELLGSPVKLAPVSATYGDFVDWQTRMLESEEGEAHWQYWASRLSGTLPVLSFSFRKPIAATLSFAGGTLHLNICGTVYAKLKAYVRDRQATTFSALATAFSILLHRLSGQQDVLIGAAVSGRTRPEWADVIGDFINIVPMRLAFPAGLRGCDHLQAVTNEIRNALAHQDFPFPLIVERLGGRREPGRSPVFQAMINVHVARAGSELSRLFHNKSMPMGGSNLTNYPMPQQEGQFELSLDLLDTGGELVGSLRYAEDAFDNETAAHLASQFASLLAQILADPESPVADYTVQAPTESGSMEHFVI